MQDEVSDDAIVLVHVRVGEGIQIFDVAIEVQYSYSATEKIVCRYRHKQLGLVQKERYHTYMNSTESLELFGTVALADEVWDQFVFFGRATRLADGSIRREYAPGALCFALWIAVVPENLRPIVQAAIEEVFQIWHKKTMTPESLQEFRGQVQDICRQRISGRGGEA